MLYGFRSSLLLFFHTYLSCPNMADSKVKQHHNQQQKKEKAKDHPVKIKLYSRF
jgi:hypothetical protein